MKTTSQAQSALTKTLKELRAEIKSAKETLDGVNFLIDQGQTALKDLDEAYKVLAEQADEKFSELIKYDAEIDSLYDSIIGGE